MSASTTVEDVPSGLQLWQIGGQSPIITWVVLKGVSMRLSTSGNLLVTELPQWWLRWMLSTAPQPLPQSTVLCVRIFHCSYPASVLVRMIYNFADMINWSASAKLAVIFPGFSFVTGLVLCNHQRFFCLGFFCQASASCWASKRSAVAALLWCVWILPQTVKISHDQSRIRQIDIHPLLFYTPQPTQ